MSLTNEAVQCNISHIILSTHEVAYRKRAYICVFLSHNVRTWMCCNLLNMMAGSLAAESSEEAGSGQKPSGPGWADKKVGSHNLGTEWIPLFSIASRRAGPGYYRARPGWGGLGRAAGTFVGGWAAGISWWGGPETLWAGPRWARPSTGGFKHDDRKTMMCQTSFPRVCWIMA